MHTRSFVAVAALAVVSATFTTSPADAADTTLGQAFVGSTSCSPGTAGFTALQTGPSAYSAPAAGVITSWNATAQTPYSAGFRVGRSNGDSTYSIVGTTSPILLSSTQNPQQSVRIPVRAGDSIGFYIPPQNSQTIACAREVQDASYTYAYSDGDAATVMTDPQFTSIQLNVSAVLEPDADGDGFGDTTQDKCSTQASTQGACADVTAPQTTITKVTAAKIKSGAKGKKAKAKVTVAFRANEAATFTCSIDGKAYASCSSPLTRKLKKGSHTVAVRARDAAGNTDATPATRTFTVKKAKPRK